MLQKILQLIDSKHVIVEVFGLGYVGFPLAVRLANGGFNVRGIDVNTDRILRLENNELKESELKLKSEFFHARDNKHLELASSPTNSDSPKVGIICVHTPIPEENLPSDSFVKDATEKFLQTSKEGDVVILESSVGGGTTEKLKQLIEDKGYNVGTNFGLCYCPERIDPQNKKWNLENIPRIIYCSDDTTFKISQTIYKPVNNANLLRVASPKIAEVVKSYENAFRLVNISLVNELATLCDKLGINVKDVIDAAATKPFGFMPFYPGAGAGGHCVPKDPRFLLEAAKKHDIKLSAIENALDINFNMPKYICDSIQRILENQNLDKSVLVCGLAYKPDVEDMRDSPGFKIMKQLSNNSFKVAAYDPYFNSELLEKYLKENYIEKLDFEQKADLNDESIKGINCICIVQHHTKTKFRIKEIYEKSLVPFIYDCQNVLEKKQNSKTILDSLGS